MVVNNVAQVRYGLSLENARNSDDQQIGILRCGEYVLGHDDTFKVLVYMNVTTSDVDKVSVMDFTVKDPTYATTSTIDGVKSLYSNKEYYFTLSPLTSAGVAPIGSYDVSWSLNGDAVSKYVLRSGVDPNNKLRFSITTNSDQPDSSEISSQMTITATITNHDNSTVSTSFSVLVLNENVIMTRDSNPVAMDVLHNAGLASNANAMTKGEAENVTDISRIFRNKNSAPFSFFEFRYFTGVTSLATSAFQGSSITEIALPENLTTFGAYCFNNCTSLRGVYVTEESESSTEIVYNPTLPDGTTSVSVGMFRNCSQLNDFTLPNSVTTIGNYAFGGTGFRYALLHDAERGNGVLRLSDNIVSIAEGAFETEKWTPETTNNRLVRLELPANFRLSPTHEEILGRNYESFYVVDDNPSIMSIDGILYDRDKETFLRYPPKKEYVEVFDTTPTMVISQYAFFAVEGIDTLIFGGNTTSVSTGVCRESKVKLVDLSQTSISELRYDSFYGCDELETVLLPTMGNLKKLGRRLFYGCTKLANINLPEGITEFECDSLSYAYTFAGCNALSAVVFPTTVEKLGMHVVYNCPNVKTVVFPTYLDYTTVWKENGSTVFTEDVITVDDVTEVIVRNRNVPFHIINGSPLLEYVTLPVMSYNVEREDGTTESVVINELSLTNRWVKKGSPATAITQSSGMFLIENGSRSNIKEYNFPAVDNGEVCVSVGGIIYNSGKDSVLLAPCNISHVDLEPTVERIGGFAFAGSNIETISFGSRLMSCGENAFYNCANFRSSEIVKPMLLIGEHAFDGVAFTNLEITEKTIGIPQYAFFNNRSLTAITFSNFRGSIGRFGFANAYSLKTIKVSGERAPKLDPIWKNSGSEDFGWYQFSNAGTSAYDKEVIVSVDTSASYTRIPGSESTVTTYVPSEETTWNKLFTDYGFTLKEELYVNSVSELTVFVGGTEYTGIVYADSSLGNLVGLNNTVYSMTYNEGSYLIDLNGVLDGEIVRLYSDNEKTNLLGTLVARINKPLYQVGIPSLGANRSMTLSAPAVGDDEMADITKTEYNELVSRVNQMMKIIKNLVK